MAQIDFCTLGMFIIDEIEFPPPKAPVKDILGGAGTYSVVGARIFSPPPLSKTVGWVVDCGSDFPDELRHTIADWQTSCLMRETPERLTTRGWNGYGENDFRSFKYTTPKLRLDQHALTPQLLASKCFHLICSPLRCVDLVKGIIGLRDAKLKPPMFVWEPVPDLCTPNELENCRAALKLIDVVSPNHSELAAFFGVNANRGEDVDRNVIRDLADSWLSTGIGRDGSGAIAVRAGKDGCYAATRESTRWVPAYHQSSEKVVDPTGGGNGFLGGLGIALARGKSIEEAAIWGSISASFCIEQVGMPVLSQSPSGEVWNGENVQERLSKFLQRV
ncbi:Ribokinase-like protein [Tothia fuscella]|uniref:Ribokinase-like protein n=1 Tax=Tothia fuscella TaxID=1048955 RepID=A0A9P4U357_9PEZI|nr:Ribokinase-like protein [Tothia fuscella]